MLQIKLKHRLIFDEIFSFGTVGLAERAIPELYNVPVRLSDPLFYLFLCLIRMWQLEKSTCLLAPSRSVFGLLADSAPAHELWLTNRYRSHLSTSQLLIVNDFQRINGPSFVFSASMTALLAVSASERNQHLALDTLDLVALQENIRATRAILGHVDCITILAHPTLPIIYIYIRSSSSCDQLVTPCLGGV